MPAYGIAPNIRPGQLDDDDTTKLWDAVASGLTFQRIKEYMFYDRFDITAGTLEDHAERIGACWSGPEDFALLHSGITEFSNHDQLVVVRERLDRYISPSRSLDDIHTRFEYLMARARDYNLRNSPAGGPSQDAGQSVYDTQSYIQESPRAISYYPTPGSSSFQAAPVSPSLGSASPRGSREHGGSCAAHGGNNPSSGYCRWTPEMLESIRVKAAEGLSISAIHQKFYPRCSYRSMDSALWKSGFKTWSTKENKKVLDLHKDLGDNWAQISSEFRDIRRSEKEVEARVVFLGQPQTGGKQRGQRDRRHKYTPEEDKYITHQVAQHVPFRQIKSARFPDVSAEAVRHHAAYIRASRRQEDDERLEARVQ